MRDILEACRTAEAAGKPAVLATVVKTVGSTYRRPGARMLIPEEGEPVGLVSGGCLEADLTTRAREVLRSGQARTVVYDMRSPDDIVWGLGLGCNGEVRVLLAPLTPGRHPDYLNFLRSCRLGSRHGLLATVFEVEGALQAVAGDHLMFGADEISLATIVDPALRRSIESDAFLLLKSGRSEVKSYTAAGGRAEVFLEYLRPAPRLAVYGAGQDALPVVQLAARLGWAVTVADNRPEFARRERFPAAQDVVEIDFDRPESSGPALDEHTVVLVMTHHFLHDLELLKFLLPSPAAYLGVLGPRKRLENLLGELARQGVHPTAAQLERLHGPVGLDIGADSPEEIALSALAEIRAVLSGRGAGFLRERRGPLH